LGQKVWLARALILLVVIGLGYYLPTLFFDDAYITFRYAANLARGDGLAYNPPERVLGVTTPLLTLLLAAAARLGADIESAALVAGLAGHALLSLAVFEAVALLLPDGIGGGVATRLLAALACALHPHLAVTAVGGMETPIYCALIVMTLTAAARGRPAWAGALFGAALLARPDAALLAPPAAWLLWRAGRPAATRAGLAAIAAASVAGPWLLFASYYYGSAVPHSIAAKRMIHPYGAADVLADLGRFLLHDPYLLVALPLSVWAVARSRHPLARALAGFALLYLTALVFGGIEPFAWYVNPLIPPSLALGAAGFADIVARAGWSRAWAPAAATALVVCGAVADMHAHLPELRDDWDAWEGTYEIAARWIMADSKPGDRVYVGETGVIGYLLPGRFIIDSSGISSPEVTRLRSGRAENDPEWSRRIIREMGPDYITTSVAYLNIETIAREPWFEQDYEEVAAPLVKREGQVIYRRRKRA